MARKDVSLVISAKDQASKAVKGIAAGLEDFRVATEKLESSARGTDKSLDAITKAVKSVEASFDGLDIDTSFEQQIRSAEAGIAALKAEAATLRSTFGAMEQGVQEAAAAQAELAAETKAAAAAQKAQRAVLRDAKKEQDALSKAAEKAGAAQAEFAARQASLPGLIAKQNAELAEAEDRYLRLGASIAASEKPSKSLANQFAATGRHIADVKTTLGALTNELSQIDGSTSAAASAMAIFSAQAQAAASNVGQQEKTLVELTARLGTVGDEATAAGTKLKGLEVEFGKAVQAADRLDKGVERSEKSLLEIGQAGEKAATSLRQLEGIALSEIEQALVEQATQARAARSEFEALTDTLTGMRAAFEASTSPTKEMVQALSLAEQAADEAQLKFMLQDDALNAMGAAYRGAGTDIRSLGAALDTVQGQRVTVGAGLDQIAKDGFQARQAIRSLGDESAAAKSKVQTAAGAVKNLGNAAGQARPKLSQLGSEIREVGTATNSLVGINQRIGSEVRGLIASYAGIYGVIQLLSGVVNAYTTLESVQARLQVANNDSISATADDMQFAREQADRLGIGMGLLADEYSKIRIASQNTNLEGERSRDIFLSIAEAGRVLRLSQEDMQGIFRATQQIMSKGKVTAEELTQQLGDRLPGAVQLMADGLGVGTAELFKMMEQGQVTSDALVGFADQLDARFSGGLDEALSSASAEMGRLQNAAFLAMEAFGNSGFMESYIGLLRQLGDTLKSADFMSFAQRLGSLLGIVIDAVALLADNFQFFSVILGGLAGGKVFQMLNGLVGGLKRTEAQTAAANVQLRALALSMSLTLGTGTKMSIMLARLALGLRALTAAFLPLAAITAGGALFGWLTSSTDFNSTLEEHARIMELVSKAYEDAGGNADNFGEALKNITPTELENDLLNLGKIADEQIEAMRDSLASMQVGNDESTGFLSDFFDLGNFFSVGLPSGLTDSTDLKDAQTGIAELITQLENGDIGVDRFRSRLDGLNQTYRDATGSAIPFLDQILKSIPAFEANRRRILEASIAQAHQNNETERALELQKELDQFNASASTLSPTRNADADKAAEADAKTQQTIADLDYEIRQQELLNAGRREQAELEAASREARADNQDISIPEIKAIHERIKAIRELAAAEEQAKAQARTDNRIQGLAFEARQRRLIAAGLDRQAAIEKAIFEARAENENLNFADAKTIREAAEAAYDQAEAEEALTEAREGREAGQAIIAELQAEANERALLTRGLEEEAAVLSALQDARAQGVTDDALLKQIADRTRANFQAAKSEEALAEAQEKAAEAAEEKADAQGNTRNTISDLRFEVAQQQLLTREMEEQVAVNRAIRAAQSENKWVSKADLRTIEELTREHYRLEEAANAAADAEEALSDRLEEVADAQEVFTESIRGLLAEIPELEGYLEDLEEQEAFDKLIADAIESAKVILGVDTSWQEMMGSIQGASWADVFTGLFTNMDTFIGKIQNANTLWTTMQGAVGGIGGVIGGYLEGMGTKTTEQLAEIFGETAGDTMAASFRYIMQDENPLGFWPTPEMDIKEDGSPDRLRIGYSSDTYTRAATGEHGNVVAGMTVTQADAEADLLRRIALILEDVREKTGGRIDDLPPEVQAVVASIGYNYGTVPPDIVAAVATGVVENIAKAIESKIPGAGVNAGRRRDDAATVRAFASEDGAPVTPQTAIDAQEDAEEAAEKAAEDAEEARKRTEETIQDNEFAISQQELVNAGKERQAAIEEAIRDARKDNPAATEAEIAQIAEQAAKTWDLAHANWADEQALKAVKEAQAEVNAMLSQRGDLMDQLEIYKEQGNADKVKETEAAIAALNEKLLEAIAKVQAMWGAIDSPEAAAAVAGLQTTALEIQNVGDAANTYFTKQKAQDLFFNTLTSGFERFAQLVGEGKGVMDSLKEAFRAFASDFLIQIGKMILQQAIFNALKAAGGTGWGSALGLGGFGAAVQHSGGVVGAVANRRRQVNPAIFAGAMRYHGGGVVGLKPGEVPIIAEEGERILTEEQQAMQARGPLGAVQKQALKIVNAFSGSEVLDEALSSPEGDEVFVNWIRRNRGRVKAVLT